MSSNDALSTLIDMCRWVGERGWCPATVGNFSLRKDAEHCYITASGKDKSRLTAKDFLLVNQRGEVLDDERAPSVETRLHTTLYQLDADIGVVLHTHSISSTVLSRAIRGDTLTLSGYEMQKMLAGIPSHETEIQVAIFDNDQDIAALAERLIDRWRRQPLRHGFLVRGHGLYSWGRDLNQARRHLEGLEFLFTCELQLKLLEHR